MGTATLLRGRFRSAGILFGLALVVAGCAGPAKVIVTQAPGALDGCPSFGWRADGGQPASFLDQWIRAESLSLLEARGYPIDEANPACVVSYALANQPRSRSGGPSVGIGAGGGSGSFGGGMGISLPVGGSSNSVSLALKIINTGQRAEVWGGSLDRALPAANPQESEVRLAVQKILAEFPVRSANR